MTETIFALLLIAIIFCINRIHSKDDYYTITGKKDINKSHLKKVLLLLTIIMITYFLFIVFKGH